LQFVL
jgi:structure-specific recognition protein 1